jgi:predicted transposase/invertase (TIGR01784 family)
VSYHLHLHHKFFFQIFVEKGVIRVYVTPFVHYRTLALCVVRQALRFVQLTRHAIETMLPASLRGERLDFYTGILYHKPMEQITPRLNPLNDYLFLKVMGEKGDEAQLSGFLNAVLRRAGRGKIVSLEILEHKTFTAEIIGDKTSILDIRAVLADGTKINIEVQVRNVGNMDKRSLFYWSKEYTKGIDAGQDYIELPNVVSINIVNFEFFPGGGYHTTFHLWEDQDKNMLLTDALEIHFVDMVKFRALREKDIRHNPLHRWLIYLDKDSPPELVEEVVKMDAAIQKAQERTAFIASDKKALHEYHLREMALSDWTSGVNHARREGEKEKAAEIALNLKKMGIPMEQIAQATGLTGQQIKGL